MVNSHNSVNLIPWMKKNVSTAYPLLWSFLAPSIWNLWKAQVEKYGLREDHQSHLDIPDLQGKKWLETEPETFIVPGGVTNPGDICPNHGLGQLKFWPFCTFDQDQFRQPGSASIDHSVIFTRQYWAIHFSPATIPHVLPQGHSAVGGRAWGLAAILKLDKVTHLGFSDSAIFKFHNLAVLK